MNDTTESLNTPATSAHIAVIAAASAFRLCSEELKSASMEIERLEALKASLPDLELRLEELGEELMTVAASTDFAVADIVKADLADLGMEADEPAADDYDGIKSGLAEMGADSESEQDSGPDSDSGHETAAQGVIDATNDFPDEATPNGAFPA